MSTAHNPSANGTDDNKTPLNDFGSARFLLLALGGALVPPEIVKRITPEWLDGLTLAQQDGAAGIVDWVKTVKSRDPTRAAAIQSALDEAEASPDDEPAVPGPTPPGRPPRLPPGTRVRALDQNNYGEVVDDYGDELDVHFVSQSGSEATKRLKRDNLRRPDGGPLDRPEAEPFQLKVLGTSAFIRADYRREWFVRKVMVKGRPGVIGGPQKSMKTSITVDVLVSLATATRFLGEFEVPRPTKVLLISGESGAAVVQETCRRVCRAKGIDPDVMDGFAYWGFDLPRLDSPEQLAALAQFIQDNEIEVVILDPLYLCLLTGGHSIDPANLFDVGPLLKTITQTCLDAGSTPFLVHHFRKNRENPNGPPELEDLSFAGIQEFARQWILINRRERYEPGSGDHKLWLSVGGSDGHSGEWAVDICEGTVHEDFRDRDWNVIIHKASEAREEVARSREAAKAAKAAKAEQAKADAAVRKRCDALERALGILRGYPDGLTKRRWREALGCNNEVISTMIETLLGQGRICPDSVISIAPNGKQHHVEGYRYVTNIIQESTRDNLGQPGTNHIPCPSGPGPELPGTLGRDTPPYIGGVPSQSRVDVPDQATRDKKKNHSHSPGLDVHPGGGA
jgi:hypothetical protein